MASIDENFIVKTGITVGTTTINAASGNITIGGTVINGTTGAITTTANINTTGSLTQNGVPVASSTVAAFTSGTISGVTGTFTSVTTANAQVTGGAITGTPVSGSTVGATVLTTANAQVTGGAVSGVTITNSPVSGSTVGATVLTTANAQVTGGAINGTVIGATTRAAGNFSALNANGGITGTLQTAAQSNITSVGTLTSLATTGDATIGGNLTVSGTTTTINATELSVADLNITVAKNAATAAAANGAGLTVAGANATLIYGNTNDNFTFNKRVDATSFYGSGVGLTSVPKATNIAGGAAYQIPYQSALNTTAFVTAGTTGQVLTATTGGAPTWGSGAGVTSMAAAGTGISVNASTGAVTITSNATATNTISTVVARDASGNFAAGVITATSTAARYADLAENYTADAEYMPGTVVEFGGEAEVTLCDMDGCRAVAGVVSTNPAYLMNNELGGTKAAVALQGRVPCRVVGKVSKGDMMVAAGKGCARAEADPLMGQVIGKALEDFNGEQGVIEVVVGRM